MKKIILLCVATLAATLMWTPGNAQVYGETCGGPITVSSLPFNDAGNTSTYGENYESSDVPQTAPGAVGSPSSSYMGGDDVVYAYTPTQDELISISVTGHGSWTGVFVMTGCPFSSTVGGHTLSSATAALEVNGLPVQSGETYYIVISTYAAPQSTDYVIDIESVQGCEGMPEAGTASIDPNTGTSGTTANITVAGYTEVAGISQMWETKDENGDWVDAGLGEGDDINVTFSGDQDEEIELRYAVTCGVSNETDYSNVISFTIDNADCVPTGSSNNSDEIRNFTLSNLNNDSAASEGTDGYSDYSASVSPALLQAGVPYVASLTSGTGSGNHGAAIWIDLNESDSFEASEMVAFLPSSIGASATVDFPEFTLPANTALETYRLRVQYHYSKSGDLLDPCVTTSGYSETEDYIIEVETPPSCLAPTALMVDTVADDSADISWTLGDTETSWNISWGTPGYTPGDVDEVDNDTSATESYQITGLTTNTDYEFYVQADCGGDQSSWSGPVTFTTTCAAVSDFSEDFEATTGSDLPNCWSKVGVTGVTDTRASAKLSGARVLYTYSNVTIALPAVDNASAGTHQMVMDVVGNFSSGGTIEFGYLTDATDASSFVSISSIVTNSNSVSQEFVTIPSGMPSGDVVFAIYAPGLTSSLIDNVRWEITPTCPNPTGLAVDNIGETSVDIAWDVTNTAQYWNLIVREADGGAYQPSQGDITEEDLESSPYTKTGLTPNTDYEVYIVADCDMDLSNFVGPVTFTTLATPPDNDDICDATALTVDADCSGNTYTNTGSTFQTGEPRGDCFNSFTESETTVWFTFVAPASGNVTVTTDIEGTTLTDTELAIYKAPSDCTDASTVGEQVGCDQDGGDIVGSGFTSVATLVGLTEGDTYYVQVAGYSNSEGDFCIEVNDAGCIAPADLSVDNITENSADFSWTTSATQSDIYVVESSEPAPDENSTPTDTGVTSPTSLDNLTTNMAYDAYVRSDCGADGVSDWVGPKTFTTLVAPPDNDDCSDAIELVCGQSITGTTLGATASGLSATCGSYTSSSALDVFYSFEADGTSDYTVSLDAASGNSFDGILFVYSDVCGSLTSLGCSDGGNPEEMTLTAPAAGTYTVRLFRYAGTGNYTLGLECTSAISGYVYESGAWTPMDPNGNATASDNIVVIDGEASFTSDMEVNNITVNSGATLNVESVLTINGDITNNGDMIFKSTATSDGELAAVPASSSITGEFTVERYTSADRAYRFVSSPVTTSASIHANWQEGATSATDNPVPGFGTHITGSTTDQQNGFDGTVTGNPSLFTLDAANQDFAAVANTDVNTITAGEGYLLFVRGDRSIDLTTNASAGASVLRSRGALHIGDLTQTSNLSSVANEFNLIANPYQSAIDITSVIANSQNLNANYCYVYDPSLGVNGAYVTVDLSNGSNGASSQANQYVQPGQAVQVATDSNGTTSVLFSEADKAPGNHTSTFRAESLVNANGFIKTQLYTTENYVAGAKLHDNFMIHFSSAYNNVLNSEDAVKAFNFTENMGTGSLGAVYSIERREMPVDAEEIQLFTDNYEHQGYTLLVETGNLGEAKAYFVDSFTEEEVALVEGENLINFNVDLDSEQSKATDRFYLRFEEQGLFTDSSVLDHSLQLYPNPTTIESGFYLSSSLWKDQQVSISVRDLLGREVYSAQEVFTNGKIHVSPGNSLGNGTYFVEVKQGDQRIVKRFITK